MKTIIYFGDQLPKTADSTSTLSIETERIDKGYCFICSILNIVDKTTANKLLELGIKNGEQYAPIVKRKAGTNDYSLVANTKGIICKAGEQLYGKVYLPTSGDKCFLVFSGELMKEE